MKQAEYVEGTQAWANFKEAMKTVLAVPHAELQRRIEAERQASLLNPNRRGPKPKRKPVSRAAKRGRS